MPHYTVREIEVIIHGIPKIIYSVGYQSGLSGWITNSEYNNREEAQAFANHLNGGTKVKDKLTIKQWRQLRGLTQKQLASMSGIKFSTFHAKEGGKRSWKADEIKNICTVLEISIETQLLY